MILDKIARLMEQEILRGEVSKEFYFFVTERDMKDVEYYFLMNPSYNNRGRLQGQDGNYSFDYYGMKVKLKVLPNMDALLEMKKAVDRSMNLVSSPIL